MFLGARLPDGRVRPSRRTKGGHRHAGPRAFFGKVEPGEFELMPDGGSRGWGSRATGRSRAGTPFMKKSAASRKISRSPGWARRRPCAGTHPERACAGTELRRSPGSRLGFYRDGGLLPFTPHHDYDQDLFLDADRLTRVRGSESSASCAPSPAAEGMSGRCPWTPGFCWRAYSCEVSVYKENERAGPWGFRPPLAVKARFVARLPA